MPIEERVGRVVRSGQDEDSMELRLEAGELHIGDVLHIRGPGLDIVERVTSLRIDDVAVDTVREGDTFQVELAHEVPRNAEVYLITDNAGPSTSDILKRYPNAGRIPPFKPPEE